MEEIARLAGLEVIDQKPVVEEFIAAAILAGNCYPSKTGILKSHLRILRGDLRRHINRMREVIEDPGLIAVHLDMMERDLNLHRYLDDYLEIK